MEKEQPRVTVVTVTYNCVNVIERTIRNVLRQTYPNIEYIIIDGASTDGTKEVVDKYAAHLAYWMSEPDGGIYEAMNKAVAKATGEWIVFRNAGDYFFKPTTIADVMEWYNDGGEAFITGGTRTFSNDGYYDYQHSAAESDFWCRNYISHPATFIRTALQKKMPYSTDLRIAADYEFFCKVMSRYATYCCCPMMVTLFDGATGISSSDRRLAYKEKIMVAQRLEAPSAIIKKLKMQYYKMLARIVPLRIIYHIQPLKALYRKMVFGSRWHNATQDDILSEI